MSREDQDAFGHPSHITAAQAAKDGNLSDIIPVNIPGTEATVAEDNGIRTASLEKLGKLKPAFRKGGTVTAANSSFLSDGATACLLMKESKAKEMGLKPKAYLREFAYASQDPKEELLLGPAYTIPKVLAKAELGLNDFQVYKLHEAFAGQVLSNIKVLGSDTFCKENFGLGEQGC